MQAWRTFSKMKFLKKDLLSEERDVIACNQSQES